MVKKIEYGPGWEERAQFRAYLRKKGDASVGRQTAAEPATGLLGACCTPEAERTGIGRLIRGWADRVAGRR
jgi:hypothetical protein